MASPVNPLDKYASYACHFELHATANYPDLQKINGAPSTKSTDRFKHNETLLINTRTDAHQTIDNVVIMTSSPSTTPNDTPNGATSIEFDVYEPGSFAFIEKVVGAMVALKTSIISNICFGLRVVFVGRTPDNEIEEYATPFIAMVLKDMSGTFTEKGGISHLSFQQLSTAANSRANVGDVQMNYNSVTDSVIFKAKTVDEALKKLEEKINFIYDYAYDILVDAKTNKLRTVKVEIAFDPADINGEIAGAEADSNAPGEPRQFEWPKDVLIGTMIMDILLRCPNINNKINAAAEGMTKKYQENTFSPAISSSVFYDNDFVVIKYKVIINKGGLSTHPLAKAPFIFDYYFANAGKNVDVLGYDVKLSNMLGFLSISADECVDKHLGNQSKPVDKSIFTQIVHPNTTQTQYKAKVQKITMPGKSNDIAVLPSETSRNNASGHVLYPHNYVVAKKLASNKLTEWNAAFNMSPTFEIRGHRDLLELCITAPGVTTNKTSQFVNGDGIFVMVNIFMPDERAKSGLRKFFYTGVYRVMSITNTFSGNKFTQHINMLAIELAEPAPT